MHTPTVRVAAALLVALVTCACVESTPWGAGGERERTSTPATTSRTRTPTPVLGEPPELAGITAAHNRVRARVGAPPLRWNATLAESARRWANACVDTASPRGMIDHSDGRAAGFPGPVGENLHATTAPVADPVDALQGWAAEAANYDYDSNTCARAQCGHYTQVVWSATREVGCGVGHCPRLTYRTTLVCQYSPAGNYVGQRPY
jgi:pathogenesis-related protein 1